MSSEDAGRLDKVLTRLGMTDDAGLENAVAQALPRVIALAAYNDITVKQKVVQVLTHINKRMKDRKEFKLPMKSLVDLFLDTKPTDLLVLNFCMVYIEMGFSRDVPEVRAEITPRLLTNLSKRQGPVQSQLLRLFVIGLRDVQYLGDKDKVKSSFPFLSNPGDSVLVLNYLRDILLYTPPPKPQQPTQPQSAGAAGQPAATPPAAAEVIPIGCSKASLARIRGTAQWKPEGEELKAVKVSALDFALSGAFPDNFVLPHALIGSTDTHHAVVRRAERSINHLNTNLEDPTLINHLLSLMCGPGDGENDRKLSETTMAQFLVSLSKSEAAARSDFQRMYKLITRLIESKHKRLQESTAHFITWVIKKTTAEIVEANGRTLLTILVATVDTNTEGVRAPQVTGMYYTAIGELSMRVPQLLHDINLITLLFQKMFTEHEATQPYVHFALSLVASSFAKGISMQAFATTELGKQITALMQKYAASEQNHVRLAAIQWVNKLFAFDHVESRWMCIKASNDTRLDVKEEANKGLEPGKVEIGIDKPLDPYPYFQSVVVYAWTELKQAVDQQQQPKPPVIDNLLKFLRRAIEDNAKKESVKPKEFFLDLIANDKQSVDAYMSTIDLAIAPASGPALVSTGLKHLLEVLTWQPAMASEFTSAAKIEMYKKFLFMTGAHDDIRETVAEVVAIMYCQTQGVDAIRTYIQELCKTMEVGSDTVLSQARHGETKHGSLFGLGHTIKYAMSCSLSLGDDLVLEGVTKIYGELKAGNAVITSAAAAACGLIGGANPLPLPDGDIEENSSTQPEASAAPVAANPDAMEIDTPATPADATLTKAMVIKRLIALLNDKSESRVIERASLSLGQLCVGYPDPRFKTVILEGLFSTGRMKNLEVQFFVGEALSSIFKTYDTEGVKQSILIPVLTKHLVSPGKNTRQAVSVWLLSIVKYCGETEGVRRFLKDFQIAFSRLLSDPSEFAQESASKGMALVYELGDQSVKDELVNNLVTTLSTGKGAKIEVDESSEIFPEGALGETPDGKGLSTYQELCSVATEMGQPDLIYKFMNLASSHQAWNTRKGAAFGFTSIAAQAKAQIEPHFEVLVPKLYRYQFDPNPKVQEAMSQIWRAIAPDSRKVTDEYFKPIVKHLLESMGARLWRVRQAAAFALADIVSGRHLEEVEEQLEEMWKMSFRALDDVKETVRNAGLSAVKAVGNLSVKLCHPEQNKDGKKALAIVIPFLVHKGIHADAKEVQQSSITMLQKICETAGSFLQPFVSDLSVTLLECLSSLENQGFNYLQFHAGDQSQEDLEAMRLNISKTSPIADTLEMCVRQITPDALKDLVPKLLGIIRTGVGLPTRCGCASFITRISKISGMSLYAGHLLKAIGNALHDRSPTVRKSFAVAGGQIAALTADKPKALESYIANLKTMAISNDDRMREASGQAFLELSKHAADRLKEFYSDLFPIAFLCRHDVEESVSKVWRNVWEDTTAGLLSGIIAYVDEILASIKQTFAHDSWNVKRQGALALRDLGGLAGEQIGPYLNELIPLVSAALPGRLWSGKDSLLEAFTSLCISGKKHVAGRELEMISVIHKECQRTQKDYKMKAMACLHKILYTYDTVDAFKMLKEDLYAACGEGINVTDDPWRPDDDREERRKNSKLDNSIRAEAFECLCYAWPVFHEESMKADAAEYVEVLAKIP
eukprot:GFYU01004259.1.p1 GENE.GFYU01004259.1~~GFYU01004259.1.p1  ORF type:complete len:1682 (-),score=543.81 GFYU01004259.1:8-5053(-)